MPRYMTVATMSLFAASAACLNGFDQLLILSVLASQHGVMSSFSPAKSSTIALRHVDLGFAFAVIYFMIRIGRPGAYPPIVLLSGLLAGAVIVVVASATTAALSRD